MSLTTSSNFRILAVISSLFLGALASDVMHQPPLLPPPPPRAAMEEKGRSVLHSGLSDHSLGPEVLREMLLARMEDPDYLDAATRREAERRVEKGQSVEEAFRAFAKTREVITSYLRLAREGRLSTKISEFGAGGRDLGDILGNILGGVGDGSVIKGIIGDIIDQKLDEIIAAIFDNIDSSIEELIDYVVGAIKEVIDHLFSVGGDALGDLLSSVEDGLGALLDHFREEGFYGLPVQFDFETRQAILDLRDDIDKLIIILAVITTVFGVAQGAHMVDQIWVRRWRIKRACKLERQRSMAAEAAEQNAAKLQ